MNEKINKKELEGINLTLDYRQSSKGIRHSTEKGFLTEKLYIHQIIIKRDIKDRYEQLYSIKYDDYIFNETKLIENKTLPELVNYIDKQKVIAGKSHVEFILSAFITYKHNAILNGIELVKKEKVDFEEEKLPMHKI